MIELLSKRQGNSIWVVLALAVGPFGCSSSDGDDGGGVFPGGSGGTTASGGSAGAAGEGGASGGGGAGGSGAGGSAGAAGAGGGTADHLRIRFDYRLDEAGYFDEPKRRVLEEAARRWTSRIPDHFPPLPDQTTLWVVDPEDPEGPSREVTVDTWDADIMVFVGSTDTLNGGAITWNFFTQHESWTHEFASSLYDRLRNPTNYQPFVTSITFNTNRPRAIFVDSTPETDDD